MPSLDIFLAFIAASLIVLAMPGPSVLFVVARSIELGTRAGLVSVLGVAIGALIHTVLVALGLAQVFQASPLLFSIVQNLGGVYLIYLGLRTLCRRRGATGESASRRTGRLRTILIDGMMVELLNPKTALFFLAFLPQFVSAPQKTSVAPQLLLLGFTFVLLGLVSDGIYCVCSGRIAGLLKRSRTFQRIEKIATGCTYLSLGIATLLVARRAKA